MCFEDQETVSNEEMKLEFPYSFVCTSRKHTKIFIPKCLKVT